MIPRTLHSKLVDLSQKFPIVTLTGPRQSGKTTLVRAAFADLPYVSLEEPDMRQFSIRDPRGFLSNYPYGAVIDEAQHNPELFSYLQTLVDLKPQVRFILSGSSNFLLFERISQSLAGRTALLVLLPFSFQEIPPQDEPYERRIFLGAYPAIYDRSLSPTDFYPAYLQTYVERDVRLMKNIGDLNTFILFTQLCAGRIGQLINYTSLANDASISPNTAKAWLSILESSYVVYRLQPYYENFSKRLIKSPKLYFYDTGLACSLLGIRNEGQVALHYLRGALFENLILNELVKRYFHRGERRFPYFWQDHQGNEIDCLIVEGQTKIPIEIKSGKTFTPAYFDQLKDWRELAGLPSDQGFVIYGGETSLQTSAGRLVSWRDLTQIRLIP